MKQEIDFPLFSCKGTTNIFINQIIIHFLYNCNFGRAVAAMVVFIIENAELTRGNTMDFVLGVYMKSVFRGLLQSAGKVLGGMANLEGYVTD